MNNGATKGGSPEVIDEVLKSPGLETLWQLHYSEQGAAEHNTATEYIANPQGTEQGNYFHVDSPAADSGVASPFTTRHQADQGLCEPV